MINYDNKYIDYIIDYCERNTPISLEVDHTRYAEITNHLLDYSLSVESKEIIAAVYTLFYTAMNHHMYSKSETEHLSFHILIGDYISSYCTELLQHHNMKAMLEVFSTTTKEVVIDMMHDRPTDYFIVNILKKL